MSIYVVSGVKVNLLAYPPAMLYNMLLCYISATFKSMAILCYDVLYYKIATMMCFVKLYCAMMYCTIQ